MHDRVVLGRFIRSPLLIDITCPVIYPASGLAMNSVSAATFSELPNRRTGIRSQSADSSRLQVISVWMNPGAIAFTVTPLRATSCDSVLVAYMSPFGCAVICLTRNSCDTTLARHVDNPAESMIFAYRKAEAVFRYKIRPAILVTRRAILTPASYRRGCHSVFPHC